MSSIILGGLVSILPNLLASWLYSRRNDRTARQFVRYVYFIEVLKFAGLAFLVSIFLQWPQLHIIKFFSAFLLFEMARLFCNFGRLIRTL